MDQAYLRASPDKVQLAIEELLRALASVTTMRICVKEVEIAGDRVLLNTTLSGRDETNYDEPHKVRLDRGPMQDSFGFSPHRCVSKHLVRRELQSAVQEFLAVIPQFEIAPGATIVSTLDPIIQPQFMPLVWSVK